MDRFTVCDQAGKTRYDGVSLRDSYDIWQQIAVVHAAWMTDEDDMPITDMDCGGGVTLDWTDDHDTIRLFDSSCERTMSCSDCMEDEDFFFMVENDGVQTQLTPYVMLQGKAWDEDDIGECCDVRAALHDPDGHAFSGTMNYNFGK